MEKRSNQSELQRTRSEGNSMPHEQQKRQSEVQDTNKYLTSGHTSHMTARPAADRGEQKHQQINATFTERENQPNMYQHATN